jgi:hypothetical protein
MMFLLAIALKRVFVMFRSEKIAVSLQNWQIIFILISSIPYRFIYIALL